MVQKTFRFRDVLNVLPYYGLFFAECNGIDRSITMNWAEFLTLGWILVLMQVPYVVPVRRDDVGKLV